MKKALPKISKSIAQEDIHWCLEENYNSLTSEWFPIMSKWLDNSYSVFRDHEKYLILIFLVKKTFDYYAAHFIKLNWNQFFSLKKIEVGKFSIINVAKELKISKETTRRKIEELQTIKIIKKTKNGIIVLPEFYDREFLQQHKTFLKSICVFVSKFTEKLFEEKIINEKINAETIEKSVNLNFSYAWKVFFEMMIPIMIDMKILFNDIESFHIWGSCTLNQNYEIQKYLKLKNLKIKNRKDFFHIHSSIKDKVGINAMSISNITGIPRATIIRKLNTLIKKKFLYVDTKKLYYPNIQIDETDAFYKQSSSNVQRLSIFISKLLNLTIATK